MSYKTMERIFYEDASSDRFERNRRLANERLTAESTFRTGIETSYGELFLAVPRELSLLNESVLRYERRISASMRSLPPLAQSALLRGLVVDEVVSTNALEGVHSTRRQINDLLLESGTSDNHGHTRRFREFAKLYLGLSDEQRIFPTIPSDIRAIYDLVMRGEDLGNNAPDGRLFRRGPVEIIGNGGKVLHEGLFPEEAIVQGVEQMLAIVNSDQIPETYSAIVGHYVFEYIHPFYDGNGRTGRYLLALYLSRSLSLVTSLSLSRTIAEARDSYYKSFRDVERKMNHGELTPFVINILENVSTAQSKLDARLTENRALLDDAMASIGRLVESENLTNKEADILYQLAQLDLFAAYPEAGVAEVAEHLGLSMQQARRYLRRLERDGRVTPVSQRPLRFVLSDEMRNCFGFSKKED